MLFYHVKPLGYDIPSIALRYIRKFERTYIDDKAISFGKVEETDLANKLLRFSVL